MAVDSPDSAESSRSGDPHAARADSSDPAESLDSRGAPRLIWSVARTRPGLLAGTTISGALWMLPTALLPLVIGYAIDIGIGGQHGTALIRAVLLIMLLALVQTVSAAVLEWTQHTLWIHGTATLQRAAHHRITQLGGTLPRRMPSGEAVAVGSSDTLEIGDVFEVLGRAAGAVVSFLVAAVIMLLLSPVLGVLVLIGVPLATIGIAPMLRPLHRREEQQREQLGEVNALASDIVSGLRILRGVGGEQGFYVRFARASQRVRHAGVAVGRVGSWLAGAEILLPGLVTVTVTWVGARLALTGAVSVGELVAFYGMSAFLVIPVSTATEAAYEYTASMVGANRVRELLRLRRDPPPPEHPLPLPSGPLALYDDISGLGFASGELTVLDAGSAAEPLAERLAGHTFGERPVRAGVETDGTGGISLAEVAPHELRSRIVLVHHEDVLFSGPPRGELDLGTVVSLDRALDAADAHEVLDALPPGAVLDERGRALSGGQRQRLILARALCADADVLVLDEPTSAVDAHTEARIARGVRELRRGKTTIVLSQSPLWTAVADQERTIE